jgi:hypothetical protein
MLQLSQLSLPVIGIQDSEQAIFVAVLPGLMGWTWRSLVHFRGNPSRPLGRLNL